MSLDHPCSTTCPFDDLVSINGFFLEFVMEKLRFALSNLQPFWKVFEPCKQAFPFLLTPSQTTVHVLLFISGDMLVGRDCLRGFRMIRAVPSFPAKAQHGFVVLQGKMRVGHLGGQIYQGVFFFLEDKTHNFSWWFWWKKAKKEQNTQTPQKWSSWVRTCWQLIFKKSSGSDRGFWGENEREKFIDGQRLPPICVEADDFA